MTSLPLPPPVGSNTRPFLHGPEYDAMAEVLAGGQYGHGPHSEAFERELAAFLQVPDVVTVASGTAAIHLALEAVDRQIMSLPFHPTLADDDVRHVATVLKRAVARRSAGVIR